MNIFLRTVFLILLELVSGIFDFAGAALTGKKIVLELKFILGRAVICVLLRELVVMGAKIDIARGLPIIHINLVGYDEQAHWRGPSSKFAHWSLRGIDNAVSRVWNEARLAERRDYDIWIYSDHGQEDALLYSDEHGQGIEEAIASIFGENMDPKVTTGKARFSHGQRVKHVGPKVIAVGMGPIVHIYPAKPLDPEDKERVICELLMGANVPVILMPKEEGCVEARTRKGKFTLPADASEILGKDHPFLKEAATDLVALCHHPSAGEIIISGWCQGEKVITFASESGCHAGYGPEETRGFALLPPDVPLHIEGQAYLRPLHIREAAFRHLKGISGGAADLQDPFVKTFRILTYNVHGCAGLDGKISPERIARVIARQEVDVVALQELDVGRNRSGMIDQAEIIAHQLGMSFHFQPSRSSGEGQYGNAILSRYPLRMIRMGALPRMRTKAQRFFELRGALWVEIDVNGLKVNVINSHLSVWPSERLLQTEALLGPDWIGNSACQGPVILCGDFNANPGSAVCKRLGGTFRDAQMIADSHKPKSTWLTILPVRRIDHFFVSHDIEVMKIDVPDTGLDRIASDHLPLVAQLSMNMKDPIFINSGQKPEEREQV